MGILRQVAEAVVGAVQMNSQKSLPKRSKASSRPSAEAQNTKQHGANSRQHSQPFTGTTRTDGREWRTIGADARKAAENSGQTVSMLQDMLTPQDREGPNQIQEIQDNLATLAEAVMRLEKKLDALLQRGR